MGDSQSELGVTDRNLAPAGLGMGPGGTVAYWQVDDVAGAFDRLLWLRNRSSPRPSSAGDS